MRMHSIIAGFIFLFSLAQVSAQETLNVAIDSSESESCVSYNAQTHTPNGFAVELFESVAQRAGLQANYLPKMDNAAKESLDLGVFPTGADIVIGCIVQTSKKETRFDFINIFHSGYRVLTSDDLSIYTVYGGLMRTVSYYLVVLLIAAFLIVRFERRNKKGNVKTLSDGFYLVHTIATTVGFGDLFPVTKKGRGVFFAVSIIGLLIFGDLVSDLSAVKIHKKNKQYIENLYELRDMSVGAVIDSRSAEYLSHQGIKMKGFHTLQEAYRELQEGDIDAVFYNELPLLTYKYKGDAKLNISPQTFSHFNLGWIVTEDMTKATQEKIKIALIDLRNEGVFERIYHKHFGNY